MACPAPLRASSIFGVRIADFNPPSEASPCPPLSRAISSFVLRGRHRPSSSRYDRAARCRIVGTTSRLRLIVVAVTPAALRSAKTVPAYGHELDRLDASQIWKWQANVPSEDINPSL